MKLKENTPWQSFEGSDSDIFYLWHCCCCCYFSRFYNHQISSNIWHFLMTSRTFRWLQYFDFPEDLKGCFDHDPSSISETKTMMMKMMTKGMTAQKTAPLLWKIQDFFQNLNTFKCTRIHIKQELFRETENMSTCLASLSPVSAV